MRINYNRAWEILTSDLMQHFKINENKEDFIKLMDLLQLSLIEQYKGDHEKGYEDIKEAIGLEFIRYSDDEYEWWRRPEK
jgi:hypothetical protein